MSARLMQILASLAQRRALRGLDVICETQHQISTRKLEQYLHQIDNELSGHAHYLRIEYDALTSKVATLEAENAKLRAELERRVVDGWKLVPVEATREMCLAAAQERREYPIPSDRESPVVLWRAMLAAAPSAPSAPATVQGGVYSTDPLACSGCVSGCFRCRSVKVQGDGWIPVSERLPESERTVLAFYLNSHGKGRRVRAEYIAAKTKSADDGWDSDEPADYDEQADEYFWPADWYEVMDNWDDLTHMVIHEGEVTHWMPLPAAPGAAPSAPKADDPVKVELLEALESAADALARAEFFEQADNARAAISAVREEVMK